MATVEELMLIFRGKDEVSGVTGQIDNEIQSMASSAQAALASMTSGMASISTVSDNLIGSLNNGKSASELIFGTASKAETNKVLVNNMTETKDAAEDLYATVDKVTDSSLTSMQDLIPALNAFKAATGASDDEIKDITDDMANFGAAVLAQTGSTALAETAMMSLSKGIKGAFAALDQYGVSEDALKRTGKWSGDEKDVRGFMEAVTEVMGSTEALMETNQGLDALIQKAFSRGGKKIGNEFLPIIKDVKRAFIDLDNELGGNLTAGILVAGEGIDIMNSALFNVSTAVRGFQDLKTGVSTLSSWAKGILGIGDAAKDATDAVKGMTDAMAGISNAGEIGANVTSMGAAGAGVADVGKTASKGERAAEGAGDALLMADMLKSNKDTNKARQDVIKEIKTGKKYQDKIQEEMDYLQTAGSDFYTTYQSKFKGKEKQKISLSDILNPFGPDFNKRAKEEAKNVGKDMKEYSKLQQGIQDEMDTLFEKSGMGLTDAIKKKVVGVKEGITGAFTGLMDFDLKGKLTAPFSKIADSIRGFSFGESLQNALEKGFGGLGNITRGISSKLSSFGNSIKNIKIPDIKGKLGNLNKSLYQSIDSFSIGDAFKGLKDKLSGLKGAKEATKGIEEVAEVGSEMAALAPVAETAAAGAEAGAVATTTLSGAFTSMIVPALALAAVVAIMIPIVAALAAEAMLFIKLLGEFMESLNFDGINLEGSIEGIKQIATGLAYVGAAMLAMTGVSILVGINSMITLFTGITGPLKTAVKALTEAANELKQFQTVQIDPSVATNLKTISDSLTAISGAMLGLTSVTITTGFSNFIAWAFQFKDIGSALDQAKTAIMDASTKLNEFSGLTPLPDSVAQNIQNVCNSLESVGKAMGALRSIRDGQNWDDILGDFLGGIFGGVDIGAALESVKTDIYNAATALSSWSIPPVPEDIGDKIGKVSSALEAISKAFDTLRSMRDNLNWDGMMGDLFGGTDIASALNNIKTQLETASQAIANLRVGTIGEDKITAITSIGTSLQKVSEVATTISQIPPLPTNMAAGGTIGPAITAIQQAATELGKLSTTTFGEGGDPTSMLSTINNAITAVRDTLTNLAGGFAAPATDIGAQIVSGVQSGISPLGDTIQGAVSSAISSASGTASSGGQTLGRNTTDGFKSTLKLADIARQEMDYAVQAINSGSGPLADAARAAAEKAVAAAKAGAETGSPGAVARMWGKEFGVYSPEKILSGMGPLTDAAYTVSRGVVNAFGNPSLDVATSMNPLTPQQLQSANLMTTPVTPATTGNTTNIIIQEGAIPVDARNMTQKEARQMLILALESLDLFDPNPKGGVA